MEYNYISQFGSFGVDVIQPDDSIIRAENGKFSAPYGITTNSTHILVADTGNDRIQIFDLVGNHRSSFDNSGVDVIQRQNRDGVMADFDRGMLSLPQGITTTSTNILVADTGNHRIQVFDLSGTHVSTIGSSGMGNGQFSHPQGITTNSTHILVSDTNNHRIQVFDLGGTHVRTIGSHGTGDGEFDRPRGITVNSTSIIVADTGNNRMQVFDLDGVYQDKFGSPGTGNNQFNTPRDITTTSTSILVADSNNNRIQVFDLDGTYLSQFGTPNPTDGVLNTPRGITTNSTHILVADSNNNRIQVFDLDGAYQDQFGSLGTGDGQFNTPRGVATTSENILVADSLNHRIQMFDLDGSYVDQFGSYSATYGITYGPPEHTTEVIPENTFTGTPEHTRQVGPDSRDGSDCTIVTCLAYGPLEDPPGGQFNAPREITANSTHILVADTGNHRIQVFDLDGNYLRQFGNFGAGNGQFNFPEGLAITPTNILVADTENNRIQVFDLDGNYLDTIGRSDASPGTGDNQFDRPRGITATSTHLLVADSSNNRVQLFDLAPTVTITADTANGGTQNTATVSYDVVFSDAVTGFVVGDITVSGTASDGAPTASNLAGIRDTYTFDVVTTNAGTVTVSIPESVATDTAGNANLASDTYTVTVDADAPRFISVATPDVNTIVITVSEPLVGSVDTGDFTLDGNMINADPVVDGSTITITVVTPLTPSDRLTVSYGGDALTDAAGNRLVSFTNQNVPVILQDLTRPTVTLSTATSNGGTQNTDTISYTATFNETVSGFAIGDIMVIGSASNGAPVASAFVKTSTTVYTFDVVTTGDGTVTVTIPDDVAADTTTNGNMASAPYTVTVDTIAPTVTLSTATSNGGTQNTDTISYTATFSEDVMGFMLTDVGVAGTASGNSPSASNFAITSATVYTFDVATTGDGTVRITIPSNSAMDMAGNGNTAPGVYTVTVDTTGPSITGVSATNGSYSTGETVDIIVTFNEKVIVSGVPQLTLETGTDDAVVDYTTGTGGTALTFSYTVEATHTSDDLNYVGTDSLDLNGGTILAFDNDVPASLALPALDSDDSLAGSYAVIVDTEAPEFRSAATSSTTTVVITASESLDVTSDVTGLTVPGNDVSGTPEISGSTIIITVVTEIIPGATFTVSYGGTGITDVAGNALTQFTAESVTNNVSDTTGPTATLTSGTTDGTTTNSATISYTVTFNETVIGFDTASDIMVSGTATAEASAPTVSGTDYIFDVTASTDGTVMVTIPADAAADAANNGNTASDTHTVTVDITAPVFSSASTVTATTIEIIASEPIMGSAAITEFTVLPGNNVSGDVVLSGSTITITVDTSIVFGDAPTVEYTGSGITDAVGNQLAGFTAQTVTNNVPSTIAPNVNSVSATGGPYNAGDTVDITVTFDETVNVTGTPQLSLNTGTTAGYSSGTGTAAIIFQYDVISGHNTDDLSYVGTISLTLNSGTIVAVDDGAIANLVLPPITSSDSLGGGSAVIVDTVVPTVTITNADTDDNGTTASNTITYTATFSEDVTGFDDASDITVSGDAGPTAAAPTGSGDTYTFTVTATTDGTVVVSIPTGAATDPAENGNTVSEDYTVTVDTTAPGVTLSSTTTITNGGTQNTATVSYTATFDMAVTEFAVSDITVTGTASGGSPTASNFVATSPTVYTFDVVTTDDGTVIVTIPANVATDAAGNDNTVSATYTVTVDTTGPTVILSSDTSSGGTQNTATVSYTATFSEPVMGFVIGDIGVTGTASDNSPAASGLLPTSTSVYTFDVATTGDGTVQIAIHPNRVNGCGRQQQHGI